VFHTRGALAGRKVLIMGASGGDMAMTADVARSLELDFAPIPADKAAVLRELLTDRVTVANPFDIHTYLWFDPPALKRVFATAMHAGYDAVGFMLDFPPEGKADSSSFDAAIDVYIEASHDTSASVALISSLPETISARVRKRCLDGGVIPLQGLREALEAFALAGAAGIAWREGPGVELEIPPGPPGGEDVYSLSESEGKAALGAFGVSIPRGKLVKHSEAAAYAESLGFPVVIKAAGAHFEHKTEVGGVALNIKSAVDAAAAAQRLSVLSDSLLVEEMITDGVAEVLIGVIVDPQFGQVLVLGAGGVLTELLADSVTLLPPFTSQSIAAGLGTLKVAKLLGGFRGKPAGDTPALISAVLGVARYAAANSSVLREIDVNPIIVRPAGKGAAAVDALIRLRKLA
jgi:acyl-CoA synthetase (NDP forming)